ncbi:MAG: DNA-processing protein DprA [Candidatus Pacebacteria bacterium]|nr:DNA-processing protein DprA [Candidatus Paceibacterota bacterium]
MDLKASIRTLPKDEFPPLIKEMLDPPESLRIRGALPSQEHMYLCVVGSRSYSPYGKDVCERLIAGLSGYPVVIVSGLALGIDGIAHESALRAGLTTIGVPGSGLSEDVLYPRAHIGLSREIVARGGAILSELPDDAEATNWSFPKRNRLMAGMCHAILIVEAREKSGTLITARLGMEYNRDVLVVPSPIFSASGAGSNRLLRECAQIVTSSDDILEALHIEKQDVRAKEILGLSDEEKIIIEALSLPLDRDSLIRASGLPANRAQIVISAMELKGFIIERLGMIERT